MIRPFTLPEGDFAAFIFDCDGTLADSMPLYHRAWRHALRQNGATFDFSWELFMSRAGMSTELTVAGLNAEFGTTLDAALVRELHHGEYERLVDEVRPIAEVVAIAKQYLGKTKLGVASGGARHLVERTLTVIGARDLFEVVVVAEDVARGKPDPDIFLFAAERLGVMPERCLVFEDGQLGIEGARRAGMQTVLIEHER